MKFTCTQENLNKGLMIVNHIASKNTTLPILNNVLLRAEQGILKLSTTNLEIGINSVVRGRVEKEGSITVTAKLLSDYINLLPNDQVVLELKDSTLHIQCKNHKTKINGTSSEEFPLIPQIEKTNFVVLNSKHVKKAFSQVLFAAANDDTRPEISGVYFNFSDKLVLAATDSYRLAEKVIPLEQPMPKDQSIIVPVKTIQEIVRSIGDPSEDSDSFEIILNDNQIKFVFNGTEIISRLVEGQYPDYKQIVPQDYRTSCFISATELANLVKSASLFCKTGLNDISLYFEKDKNQLVIKSADSQLGENISSIETDIVGESNEISFNFRYILDGLSNIDSNEVEIKIIDNNSPGMFCPKDKDDYYYIIMPIKQ